MINFEYKENSSEEIKKIKNLAKAQNINIKYMPKVNK
jgi:hypothetical protein